MFSRALSYNQPLDDWDVSNDEALRGMFFRALAFNQVVSNWTVTRVQTIQSMLEGARSFDQSLCAWANKLPQNVTVLGAFSRTACPMQEYPILQAVGGPSANLAHRASVNVEKRLPGTEQPLRR